MKKSFHLCPTKFSNMTINIESRIAHPSPAKKQNVDSENNLEELKTLFHEVLESKNEIEDCNMKWIDEKTVQVDKLSGISLHKFLLKVEEMGKDISYTKKTVIEIK